MMASAPIITFMNNKGGVGKTTTAINFATLTATLKGPTLLIDFDAQSNATLGLGLTPHTHLEKWFMIPQKTWIPNLSIISGCYELMHLEDCVGKYWSLATSLKMYRNSYAYIIIDAPPALGFLAFQILLAATHVIIPVQCEFFALQGLSPLITILDQLKHTNPFLCLQGIVLTLCDVRNTLHQNVCDDIFNVFQDLVYKTVIPRNISVAEAAAHGKPIFFYDQQCRASQAYIKFAEEFFLREQEYKII